MTAPPASVELHLEPNEASDLLEAHIPALLEQRGWDAAFLAVLDEARVERCIGLLGHAAGADPLDGWEVHRLRVEPTGDVGKTEDCEALAARAEYVYVVGSHYGSKNGPLQPKRHFLARLHLSDLGPAVEGERPPLEICRDRFRLHRAVNDALRDAQVELFDLDHRAREALVYEARRKGRKKGKRWDGRIHADDLPINIEGAEFRPDGTLLLGLRFPTTADGHPLIVELPDVDALFADEDAPVRCGAVWVLDDVGTPERPLGIRALRACGVDRFDVVVGDLDSHSDDKASLVLVAHPRADEETCSHWRFALPAVAGGGSVGAELVHDFPILERVEGVAPSHDGSHYLYTVDRDGKVELRLVALG